MLPFWWGVAFVLIHKLSAGLYLGSVFAPNHKGMLITEHNCQIDFLRRQVLTARNVRAGFITDEWYGGLNYQIEHHLFPAMPRGNLPEAQRMEYATAELREKYRIASENPAKAEVVAELLARYHDQRVIVIGQYLSQLRSLARRFDRRLQHGHDGGEELCRAVPAAVEKIRRALRAFEAAARHGGEGRKLLQPLRAGQKGGVRANRIK